MFWQACFIRSTCQLVRLNRCYSWKKLFSFFFHFLKACGGGSAFCQLSVFWTMLHAANTDSSGVTKYCGMFKRVQVWFLSIAPNIIVMSICCFLANKNQNLYNILTSRSNKGTVGARRAQVLGLRKHILAFQRWLAFFPPSKRGNAYPCTPLVSVGSSLFGSRCTSRSPPHPLQAAAWFSCPEILP